MASGIFIFLHRKLSLLAAPSAASHPVLFPQSPMTVALSIHSRVQLATQQVSCDLDGDAVVLNVENGLYFELNPVGARIWTLLQEGRTLVDICDVISSEYAVSRDVCEADIVSLMHDLREAGLITASD